MEHLWNIAAVMLFSGILGGLVNFVLGTSAEEVPMAFWKHIAVGVAASFMVPLFLNMISADLIDKIRGANNNAADYSKLFVLAGFCLVASISSRRFIQSISARLLQEVQSANRKSNEAKEDAAEARAAVAPLIEEQAVEDIKLSAVQAPLESVRDLSEEELLVLNAMIRSSYTLRSLTGIATDSGLSRHVVNLTLSSLIGKDLVGQSTTSKGAPLWFPTATGRTLISNN
jgi:hypothetical protein